MAGISQVDRRFEERLEPHRAELTGYCYRMLGSPFDAEDAVQETLTRAWRSFDRFEERSSVRTWLYRIAGNVCFDMIDAGARRARPMDLSGAGSPDGPLDPPLPESTWIQPMPDARWAREGADPGEVAQGRESVRLAFIAALQHLPARQRAALILCEVLGFRAAEAAELLDSSVASVNSALQRARATLDAREDITGDLAVADDPAQRALLARYLDAFERYDIPALTGLLHEDAVQSMPPYPLWLRGRERILAWWTGPGAGCRGSRLLPAVANGMPAFAQYRPSGPGGRHEPWALQVLEIAEGRVVGFTAFLDTAALFPLFGLPQHPDD